jgi:nitroimidazol reductase NimA-like FMN-containing flavoprotein (pyridoxamine 5'-phosphate oxidase superfamily)
MRRKDRQINDMEEIKAILMENNLLHLGLSENNMPYIVPINYGYDGEFLYMHCALEGRKIEIIKSSMTEEGAPCCFEISDSIEVVIEDESAECTTHYRSIVGFGKLTLITDTTEKLDALKILVRHIEKREPTSLPEAVVKRTRMLRIKIEEINGKKSPLK